MDWRHTSSARLALDVPVEDDVEALFAIHTDPDSWRHFPSGRHLSRETTVAMVNRAVQGWADHALGYWTARLSGAVVGIGGCAVVDDAPWWNLYYRLSTAVQGQGLAVELSRRAIAAAHEVEPERPVLAYLLEHNVASRLTAERSGLQRVWRGPDAGNPDPGAVRLVYLDRDAGPELLARWDSEVSA